MKIPSKHKIDNAILFPLLNHETHVLDFFFVSFIFFEIII